MSDHIRDCNIKGIWKQFWAWILVNHSIYYPCESKNLTFKRLIYTKTLWYWMLADTPHGKFWESCDKVEKDDKLGIWDENQDSGKILYFSSSRILVKKMGKRWSHRKNSVRKSQEKHILYEMSSWCEISFMKLMKLASLMKLVSWTCETTTGVLRQFRKRHFRRRNLENDS